MACPITVIKNTLPTVNDDSVNTSGNGLFVKGSYWLFEDSNNIECKKLFLNIQDGAGVADWKEINIKPNTNLQYISTDTQTFPRNSYTPLIFDLKDYDEFDEYNNITGEFIPKCDGTYQFTLRLNLEFSTHQPSVWPSAGFDLFRALLQIELLIDGVVEQAFDTNYYILVDPASALENTVGFSPDVHGVLTKPLTAGQTVTTRLFHSLGDNEKLNYSPAPGSDRLNSFNIERLPNT
jgi:hypothetical protein